MTDRETLLRQVRKTRIDTTTIVFIPLHDKKTAPQHRGKRQMIAYDQVFSDATVYLDGNSFYRCKFERCTVIINGYMGCTLVDPRFIDCKWKVSGPAENVFALLSGLYQAGATDLIEATFQQIRGGAPS
jgi:hypothetical protein